MTTIEIAGEDALAVRAMIATGLAVHLMTAVPEGLRVPETPDPITGTDRAGVTRMTAATEAPPMIIRGDTVNQAPVAALCPILLQPPDLDPKAEGAHPVLEAPPKSSTQRLAPRNNLLGDLLHARTPDPCPGHAPAPGPGLDASLEATDCPFEPRFISR